MKKIIALLYALRTIKKDYTKMPGAGILYINEDGSIQVYSINLRTYFNAIYEGPASNGSSVLFDIINGKAHIRV